MAVRCALELSTVIPVHSEAENLAEPAGEIGEGYDGDLH